MLNNTIKIQHIAQKYLTLQEAAEPSAVSLLEAEQDTVSISPGQPAGFKHTVC